MVQEPEPPAFDDSRRLTGLNRWFGGPAVELSALGPRNGDPAAWAEWAERVRRAAAHLGWPDPAPRARPDGTGAILAFAAPEDTLFTATEVNEWAWDPAPGEAERQALARFSAAAQAEASPPLQRLRRAAQARGVPVLEDDDTLTLGEGAGSRSWPRAALPLAMDVPWAALHGIPKALVTGSNGKTTTVRLLAAIARAAGQVPGYSSTGGVVIGEQPAQRGDWSGPAGAREVLRSPAVTLAVLETARGGLARRGLAVAQAEVAVVTNISPDHFGEYGVHGLADLAELKLVVARAVAAVGDDTVGGLLVLNADDAELMAAAERLPHARASRRALFAAEHGTPALAALRAQGGSTCGVQDGRLLLADGAAVHDLGAVADLPLALGGAAPYNLMNIAAAALAAHAGLRLPLPAIAAALQRFGRTPDDNPGRLERWRCKGATVLIDYAHNPDGLAQLLAVARALPHRRLLLLLGQAGNRDDAAITELGQVAAAARPDLVLVKELHSMLRGRPLGQVPDLLAQALLAGGLPPERQRLGGSEQEAALALLAEAGEGDVVVLPLHDAASRPAVREQLGVA